VTARSGTPETVALRRVHVLDKRGGFSSLCDVVVERGVVREVGPSLGSWPGAVEIDCHSLWLMPGIVDAHVHIAVSSLDALELLRSPITLRTLETAANLRRTLTAGVTTVRDAGGADAGIRDAVERSFVPGPRLKVATVALTPSGGHGDGFLAGPGFELPVDAMLPEYPGRPPYRVDGPEEVRRAVRLIARAGADHVKVFASGGVLSEKLDGRGAGLDEDELAAAGAEARRQGLPLVVHVFGGHELDAALAAGATSIEHGLYLSEAQAARMAELGCTLVPTLAIYHELVALARSGRLGPRATERAIALERRLGEPVRVAREAGVRIALGSDFATREQHGRNLEEIAWLAAAGLPLEEALLSATLSGAELLGLGGDHGRIAPGFVFDAVVFDREPSVELFRAGHAPIAVFQGGSAVLAATPFDVLLASDARAEMLRTAYT
jgi:imidazolonepropionase-like amidohydrolase